MNRKYLFIVASALTVGVLSLAACSSDDNATSSGGLPPNNVNPNKDSGTVDSGNDPQTDGGTDSGLEPVQCNGAAFDNERIPGWPTVPTP